MKNKSFDCVEFQDRAGERIYEQIKGMTIQEQLEFWRKQTEILRRNQQAARGQMAGVQPNRPRTTDRTRLVSKSRK
jgi:hypothetical protein